MLELLLGLLEIFLELVLEAGFEFGAAALTDLILRGLAAVFDPSDIINPKLAYLGYFCIGAVSGCLSLLFFPHPMVHPSKIPGLSLIVSPVLTGMVMWSVGHVLRTRGKKVLRIESFGYGFAFAFGMALVRLVFTRLLPR